MGFLAEYPPHVHVGQAARAQARSLAGRRTPRFPLLLVLGTSAAALTADHYGGNPAEFDQSLEPACAVIACQLASRLAIVRSGFHRHVPEEGGLQARAYGAVLLPCAHQRSPQVW